MSISVMKCSWVKCCSVVMLFGSFLIVVYVVVCFVYFCLTFRHRASCILGQAFHYSPENAFLHLIKKYISLSDICLTVLH